MSDGFQNEIAFLGIASSPAFVREPEGNGCIERFYRTLKEQLLWVRDFTTLEELAEALEEFRQRYKNHWLPERLSLQSPRQARREAACPRGCCMMIIKKNCPGNRVRYSLSVSCSFRASGCQHAASAHAVQQVECRSLKRLAARAPTPGARCCISESSRQ